MQLYAVQIEIQLQMKSPSLTTSSKLSLCLSLFLRHFEHGGSLSFYTCTETELLV